MSRRDNLEKHIFSEPWKGSDIVLVVEDQKFHVHRLMLSMSSSMFEAMFSSDFKEKDASEIQLPGKKANEMLHLLKQVYPQERGPITSKISLALFFNVLVVIVLCICSCCCCC